MLIVRARDRQVGKGRVDRENDFVLRFKMCQRNDQGREEFPVLERGEGNDYGIWHAKLPGLCGS